MNILQILPSLDVGGVETGTIDLAKFLVARGHKAITISSGGKLVRELDAISARHYNLPVGKKSPINIMVMINRVSEIIRREDIDIVHARSRVPAIISYFACKATGRVFVTTAHGYYKKHLLSAAMGWGKIVIVASNIMAKHMAHNFGVPHERIRLIPRGVDLSHFNFKDLVSRHSKEFTIGIVSRITPLKGHADFIKAVSILSRQIPQLKAVIIGSAPKEKYREDLELLTRRLGITKTVEFIGATGDVPQAMAGLNVLVSATVTPEAFGRSIIEAQASGVPVVATSVGGVVDIIEDQKTGLLCAPHDPKDMANKVIRYYKDREFSAAIAREARRRVESDFNLNDMAEKTVAVYEEAVKRANILVIKMSAAGDVILSIPSLKAIRGKFPNAFVKVLVGLKNREILDGCPYINDRIICDFDDNHKGALGLWRLGVELRKSCFDIVIDLQNNRRSHMLAALSLASLRYGYDNKKFAFLLNKKIKDDAPYLDPIEHQFRTLKLAGIKPLDRKLELWPSVHDAERVEKFLTDNWIKQDQQIVGINVRASEKWPTKNWPANSIVQLCDRLAKELNIRVVLTGTREDAVFADSIARMAKSKPVIAAGKTSLMELGVLIKRCAAYLTPDSAPMHIAASMGTPFVALFGPTDPARHVVRSGNYVILQKADNLKCVPCYSQSCRRKYRCMKNITVDDVFGALCSFLKKEGAK